MCDATVYASTPKTTEEVVDLNQKPKGEFTMHIIIEMNLATEEFIIVHMSMKHLTSNHRDVGLIMDFNYNEKRCNANAY